MRAGIALGSNLGDRLAHLQAARLRLLALHDESGPFLCSKIYETAPVDCPDGSPHFLNAAIELSTQAPPLDLLNTLQRIEIELGRPPEHLFHGPRPIDLDLLYCGDLRISHTSLTLPHPAISDRLFVLKPLMDICPERIASGGACVVRELCEKLEISQDVSHSIKFISFF
ncbi:MAG: 2-amino-4-hydroxy-6-hydroxymethyldihydropteridine diphosphokinase [Verrucomicrobiota bacterium]